MSDKVSGVTQNFKVFGGGGGSHCLCSSEIGLKWYLYVVNVYLGIMIEL